MLLELPDEAKGMIEPEGADEQVLISAVSGFLQKVPEQLPPV